MSRSSCSRRMPARPSPNRPDHGRYTSSKPAGRTDGASDPSGHHQAATHPPATEDAVRGRFRPRRARHGRSGMIEQRIGLGDPASTRLRRAYGFEEIALVPGAVTVDPGEVDLSTEIGGQQLRIPFLAAAMDAVADSDFAIRFADAGGVAFVNLEGLYTRYDDAAPVIERVAVAESAQAAASVLAEAYAAPVRDELIARLIGRIKDAGAVAAVATTPASAWQHAEVAAEAGAGLFPPPSPASRPR